MFLRNFWIFSYWGSCLSLRRVRGRVWRRFRLRLFLVTFIRFLFVVIYFLGGSFFSVVIRRCRRFSWWIRKLLWRSFVDLARVFISVIVLVFLGFRFLLIFKVWYFVFKDIILCLDFIIIVKDIYLFFICCKYIFLFYVWVLFWKYVLLYECSRLSEKFSYLYEYKMS